jgi:hypothetical protein
MAALDISTDPPVTGPAAAGLQAGSAGPGRLTALEWLFLTLTVLGWAAFVVTLGKDTSWDFRNYHWYIPYALLNDRLGLDVAVAHQASYYNPLLDVPFYWLATHTSSWFAIGVLGCVQALNVVPLYILARQSLTTANPRIAAAVIALMGMTGALTLSLLGTTYYDNVLSLFMLSGIAILVVWRKTLAEGSLAATAAIAALAGLVCGSAVGLKLPEAPFAIGFAAALLVIGGNPKHIATRVIAGGIAGAIGFALFAGYWMWKMDVLTGNPLFPYFNQYFRSPLALPEPYRDARFLPDGFWDAVILPWRFTVNWAVADDLPFRDMRVFVAYAGTIIALLLALFRLKARDPVLEPRAGRIIIAFAGVSFAVWIAIFAIYRYIVGLEMLAPLVIVAAVGMMPFSLRTRLGIIGVLFLAALIYGRSDYLDRAPLGDPYVQADIPPIPRPDHSMVLMTGNAPLGYLAPLLPHQIPILRIDGWMVQPQDGTRMTREMMARVDTVLKNKGDLYLIADAYDMGRAHDALAAYHLTIRWLECRVFESNLTGVYRFCPLMASLIKPAMGKPAVVKPAVVKPAVVKPEAGKP